jgi:hypothetical protein
MILVFQDVTIPCFLWQKPYFFKKDYGIGLFVSETDTKDLLEVAKNFINELKNYLNKK